MVSLFLFLSILNISLFLPLRWIAVNCGDLGKYGFVVVDMPKAVDLMDKAFAEITKDGNLMLDDDFMMNIFEPLAKKIKPFKEYLLTCFRSDRAAQLDHRQKKKKCTHMNC